ncbi:MAG: ATP synthase F1 subunit delta [Oscillospiraceae bacterium]|jgi:F-type H+-transporting ATPase subunit delta|nr:ATP synthase F1 subunit delta [Oscillospiraceae bacterium]
MNAAVKMYADALFELSLEKGVLSDTYAEINAYGDVLAEHPGFLKLIAAPTIGMPDKILSVKKVFPDSGICRDFLCLLTEKRRIFAFSAILKHFNECYDSHMRILNVTCTVSKPLTAEQKTRLTEKLSEKSGKTVKLTEIIDETILGGIIVDYGNTRIDSSIKGKLDKIAVQMKNT